MAEFIKIGKNRKNPTFKLMLWYPDHYKDDRKKRVVQGWSGKITHVQSGDTEFFESISAMLAFIEKYRLKTKKE